MRLNPDTLAHKRPQQFPMEQPELPNMPPPMTANRAKDFAQQCKRCQRECGFCTDMRQHDEYFSYKA